MHIHVQSSQGEAKFWMEPNIELVHNHGLSTKDLRIVQNLIEEHADEIKNAWQKYFRD